jgi:hypothetical protein
VRSDPPSLKASSYARGFGVTRRRGKEVKNHSVGKGCEARSFDTLGYETYLPDMSALSNFVSLHPYFKAHRGKLKAVKAGFPRFVEKTATEKKNLFYGFTINGDEIFCRKATPTPKAFSRISTTSGRCSRKCSPWPI